MEVDESKIQKMFITGENKQLLEMIGAIPPEYFELVEEIFEKAKKEYGFLPKEKETLALLDHIHFAIKRMKEIWCLIIRLKRKSGSFIRKSGKLDYMRRNV